MLSNSDLLRTLQAVVRDIEGNVSGFTEVHGATPLMRTLQRE